MNTHRRVFLIVIVVMTMCAGRALAQTTRIGTFDSRAVAVAYWNSEQSRDAMRKLNQEAEKAKASRNAQRIRETELAAVALQARRHQQAFSVGSVAEIMPVIENELPKIASKNGVSIIVSRWEIAWRDPAVEYVDVTDDVVALFAPSERTRKWLADMKTKPPLPLDQLPSPGH